MTERRNELDWLSVALLAVSLAMVLVVRLRYLDVPLERDEGEYAYVAQLMLRGQPLYTTAHTMKYPGTALVYAASFRFFGETVSAVHLALLPFHLASALLLFVLVTRSQGGNLAALTTSLFLLWSMMPELRGLWSHATNFALTFGLAAWLLLVVACAKQQLRRAALMIGVGILFGLSVLMKQQAVFFALPAAAYSFGRRHAIGSWVRDLVCIALGAVIPLGFLFAFLDQQGVFAEFWFWTFSYAREYAAGNREGISPLMHASTAVRLFGLASFLLDGFLLVGLVSLAWDRESRRDLLLWLCLLAGGVLAAIPGLRFTPHYFVLLVPAAAYFAAQGVASLARFVQANSPLRISLALAGCIVVGLLTAGHVDAWFQWDKNQLVWNTYRGHAFMHSRILAEHLHDIAQPGESLAVIGSEPQIYFSSGLPSVTSYIYVYPFTEQHRHAGRMETEMKQQIEAAEPNYCVIANSVPSWGVSMDEPYEPGRILDWWHNYANNRYDRIGLVSVLPSGDAAIAWNRDAARVRPSSPVWFELWQRRETPAAH